MARKRYDDEEDKPTLGRFSRNRSQFSGDTELSHVPTTAEIPLMDRPTITRSHAAISPLGQGYSGEWEAPPPPLPTATPPLSPAAPMTPAVDNTRGIRRNWIQVENPTTMDVSRGVGSRMSGTELAERYGTGPTFTGPSAAGIPPREPMEYPLGYSGYSAGPGQLIKPSDIPQGARPYGRDRGLVEAIDAQYAQQVARAQNLDRYGLPELDFSSLGSMLRTGLKRRAAEKAQQSQFTQANEVLKREENKALREAEAAYRAQKLGIEERQAETARMATESGIAKEKAEMERQKRSESQYPPALIKGITDIYGNELMKPEEKEAAIESLIRRIAPQPATPTAGPTEGIKPERPKTETQSAPPVQGAKQDINGNWWIQGAGGKYIRVWEE